MSLPPLTEFDDPVARFLEWHHIRAFYADNDDAAMAKAYPQAKKQLKKWEAAFISLPKDSWAKRFFMTVVGFDTRGQQKGSDNPNDMAELHYNMAFGMPWTADQGLAYEYQKKLEQEAEEDDAFADLVTALPNAIAQYTAKKSADTKRFSNLHPKAQEQEINVALDRDFYAQAIVKAAQAEGVDITKPEYRERIDAVISELDALQPDPSSDFEMQSVIRKMLLHIGVIGAETPPWQQATSPADEAPIKDDTVIKSAKAPVEQQAPSAKAFTVEQALLNPKASKDRSKYKSAYFLWGQIKSHADVGEHVKLTETQAATWAGVAKGQHTKDVIKVLVDVRAIKHIKGTLDYRRLV